MLITFKTLQQKTFKIEINDTEKVKDLKEKIAAERGDEFPVEGQKLIYAGKILDDGKVISEYNIDTVKNFVVVMAIKPKAKSAEKPKSTETSTSAESSTSTTTEVSTTPASTPAATTATTSTAAASETTAESTSTTTTTTSGTPTETEPESTLEAAEGTLLTGSALETSITELMSLGFGREEVIRALNSSYHNADRAAEYLFSGNIPELVEEDAQGDPADNVPPASDDIVPPALGDSSSLTFLRSLPQFQLMRQQLQEHPESLPQLLQQIGQSNPQLLQLISQNQEAFVALLNEASEEGGGSGGSSGGVSGGVVGGGSQGGPGGQGGFQIQVTTEEKAAIERIVGMGFPEAEVIQAFFACEKNEQLTINFLLNS